MRLFTFVALCLAASAAADSSSAESEIIPNAFGSINKIFEKAGEVLNIGRKLENSAKQEETEVNQLGKLDDDKKTPKDAKEKHGKLKKKLLRALKKAKGRAFFRGGLKKLLDTAKKHGGSMLSGVLDKVKEIGDKVWSGAKKASFDKLAAKWKSFASTAAEAAKEKAMGLRKRVRFTKLEVGKLLDAADSGDAAATPGGEVDTNVDTSVDDVKESDLEVEE